MSTDSLELLKNDIEAMKADYNESLDTIWMLLASLLIFFMHSGFSLLEAGCVRFKNTQNILTKNLLVVCAGFLCWYAVGWAFAYGVGVGDNPNKFIGHAAFFADGFWDDKTMFRNWFFQGAFCATGGTIVSGAMAERTQLKGFGIFVILMTSLIYPVVAYWGWSGSGFLAYSEDDESVSLVGPAYMDFAGSGLIHMVGGIGALIGACIVGPRTGRFDTSPEVDPEAFDGHNIPFVVIGTFFLWFGWYGFNPGSTLSMHDKGTAHTAGLVAMNTTLAPCASGLVVFIMRAKVVEPKLLDVGGFCNGILAGLVAITAGCAFVKPWEALLIGLIAGFVYQGCSIMVRRLKIDDVVDAFAVHGACGFWGILALGLFGNPEDGIGGNGIFYGGNQLGTQIFAALAILSWAGGLSAAIFLPLKHFGMLRLSDEFQEAGADMMEHSPRRSYTEGPDEHSPRKSASRTSTTPSTESPQEPEFQLPPAATDGESALVVGEYNNYTTEQLKVDGEVITI